MITDPAANVALSNLGWVDHGSVWFFDGRTARVGVVELSDAKYLRLHQGTGDHFALEHHWEGAHWRISAHSYANPEAAISEIEVNGWTGRVDGDRSVWSTLPDAYVGYLNDDATGAAGYYVVSLHAEEVDIQRLDWFDDDGYDRMYQGVTSVTRPFGGHGLVFGVQRSSELVFFDPGERRAYRRVQMAGRSGNPHPVASRKAPTMWATDYDMVVRLDTRRWTVDQAVLLQPPDHSGMGMFVGDVSIPRDESYLLVARPGSSDVVQLDAADLSIRQTVPLGRQPLVAAVLQGSIVIARDWKSGDLLSGALRKNPRRRFFGR